MTIALVVVAIVPLAVAVWSLFAVNRDGMHEQVLRTHALAASSAAERIAAVVALRRATADAIASNAVVTNDPRGPEAEAFLRQSLVSDAAIQAVAITTPANELVVRVQQRGVGTHAFGTTLEPALEGTLLRTSAKFPDARGIVRVDSDAAPILAALDTTEIGENAHMMLADAHHKLAGSDAIEVVPAELVRLARSARVNGTTVRRSSDGREILAAYAPVAGTGWFVLSEQPAAIAERIAGTMQRRAALAVALALILAAGIAAVAQRTVVRPIREIARAQQRLAGAADVASGNEIDQLRESTELLQRRIDDQEDLGRVFLGRYQVLGLIGQGGMGSVFRGWDPKLRRPIALKTVHLDPRDPDPKQAVSSLVTEAITIAGLNHPNIVSVYDVEESAGAAFIAMELIDGFSLESYLTARGATTTDEAILIGLSVARALAAAHAQSILHRDIKPANVLLGRDGSIKVADFGLAQVTWNASDEAGMIYGTPGYMSPETVGGNPSDPKSDLFSLGVVLYECATGEQLFVRGGLRETFTATMQEEVPPLTEVLVRTNTLVPLSEITASLLQKAPENRPESAAIVVERLATVARFHGLIWHLDEESIRGAIPGRTSPSMMPTVVVERSR